MALGWPQVREGPRKPQAHSPLTRREERQMEESTRSGRAWGPQVGRGPAPQQPPQPLAQAAATDWHRPLLASTPHLENLSRHRSAVGEGGRSWGEQVAG